MKCYLCGSNKLEIIHDHLRHGIKRNVLLCLSCGLNYLEPLDKDLQDYYAEKYRKEHSPKASEPVDSQTLFDIYLPFQAERVERLRPYIPDQNAVVLDVGCSAGHFLYAIKPFVGEVVGIEYNHANARFGRERLGFRIYMTPIEETNLPEGYFDLITVFHTLEHVADPLAFLKTIRRYLKPSGSLYVEVPNVDDALLSVYKIEPYPDFWYREPHLFNFSPSTLELLMAKAGFEGDILPVQRYGFVNHMHWILTGKPQSSAEIAMSTPLLVQDESVPASTRKRLNEWIKRVDAEYRSILKECGVSESIGFIAHQKGGN